MKNIYSIIGLLVLMALSSCVTTTKTARTAATTSSIKNATVADLQVADQRITYTMSPSKEVQRAGLSNVKQAVVQEALTKHGNADVMVEPEFVISMKNNFIFGKEVTSITVSGRPAYYKNFRTLHDSVWSDPGFYGQPKVVYVSNAPKGSSGYGSYGSKSKNLLGKLGLGKSGGFDAGDPILRRTGMGMMVDFIGGKEFSKVKFDSGDSWESEGKAFLGVLGTIGLQATTHWWFGIGSGYMYGWDNKTQHIPLYGNVRWYFSKKKNSFFLDYKIGGSFEVGGHSNTGGLFVGGAIGYSFGSFELAIEGINQYCEKGHNIKEAYISHAGLNFGFKF